MSTSKAGLSDIKKVISLIKNRFGNVENKSSATIRGELTQSNVTKALGYTPPQTNTTYNVVSKSAAGLVPQCTGDTASFLNANGTWSKPPTYNVVSQSAAGLVPQCTGDTTSFLNANGAWSKPPTPTVDVNSILLKVYPVGSIYMSTTNTNPKTLFGGEWVAWGSGKVPVGVNADDEDFSTVEKDGGAKTVSASHGHSVNSHSHSLNSHTHTIASHDHTIGTHSHSIDSHSHGTSGHALTASEIPKHKHTINHGIQYGSSSGSYGNKYTVGFGPSDYRSDIIGSTAETGGGYSHSHGDTTSVRLYTNYDGSGTTSSKSLTTAAATGTTGSESTSTSSASVSVSTLQPYITCYMWKRTK